MPLKLFIDSDVVISSLISSTGAAFLLLNQIEDVGLFVSNVSIKEVHIVTERLSLSTEKLEHMIEERFSIVTLEKTVDMLKNEFSNYVLDINDAHIVVGSKEANANFLISYNTKHFKADKLKDDFGMILTTPANILQYLRSL